MSGRERDPLRIAAAVVCLGCLAAAIVVIAVQAATGPATDRLTVERNGYLHGVRYADLLLEQTGRGEAGVRAACVAYLETPRGYDRDAFLAGCADAVEVPR